VSSEEVVYLLLLRWGLLREGMVGRSAEQRDKEDSCCCALRFDPGRPHSFYDNSFAAKKLRPAKNRPQRLLEEVRRLDYRQFG
jgi:hypothetical protein